MLWGNVVRRDVFVDTWGSGDGSLIGGRDEIVYIARLLVVTHCYLLELGSILWGDETIEMSGWGGGVEVEEDGG